MLCPDGTPALYTVAKANQQSSPTIITALAHSPAAELNPEEGLWALSEALDLVKARLNVPPDGLGVALQHVERLLWYAGADRRREQGRMNTGGGELVVRQATPMCD